MPANLIGSYVSGLIDDDSGTWDSAILNDIFSPEDVMRISRVPVSLDFEDSWFWHSDPRGCYTVKSGYKLLIGDLSSMEGGFDDWIKLWKLKIPPKWKTFLWRALSDTLPVTSNLLIRRVEVDPTCPKCGECNENVFHALVSCVYSKLVWHELNLPTASTSGGSFIVWFSSILHAFSEGDIGLAAAALYYSWRARNSAVWDAFLPLPRGVMQSAKVAYQAWASIHLNQPPALVHQEVLAVPAQFQTASPKCFFDAGFMPTTLKTSFGAVLLSHDGRFIAVCAGILPDCFSPLMAEAEACKKTLSWLSGMNLDSVAVFTDCLQLRSHLSQEHYVRSHAGFAIQACKELIASLHNCVVSFVPRADNSIAHTLATSAFSHSSTLYWDSVPPNSISDFLH